ncbi:MAG: sugar ABC transporter substrate-binding protein [Chloroflexi bacterium]|nr:sugar ABC transporter substrate-binding protein [Chloroflexota bacterium]
MKSLFLVNRRKFLKLAAAGMGAAVLAACAPPTPTPAPTQPPAQQPTQPPAQQPTEAPKPIAQQPVELRMHVRTAAEGTKTEMGIEAFQNYNPGITVKLETFPGDQYADKLLTLAAGGILGDVAFTHVGFYHAMADAGFWAELDPLIDAHNYDMSQYFETGLEHIRWNGKLYALPYKGHSGPSLIWYNKDMLAAEGITDPKPQSYEELIELALKFTKDKDGDGKTDQWGYLYAGHHGWVVTGHLRAWGTDPVQPVFGATEALINSEKAMAALTLLHELIHKHKVTPLPGSLDANQVFTSGAAAMRNGFLTMSGDQKAIGDRFTQDFAPMPRGPAGSLPGFYNHDQMAMNAKTKYLEESWKLLTYFCGKEHGIRLGLPEGGGATSCGMRRDVYGDPEFRKAVPVIALVAEQLEELKTHWYAANLQTFKVWNAIGQALDKIMLNPTPPTKADFDEANDAVQNVLDEPRI